MEWISDSSSLSASASASTSRAVDESDLRGATAPSDAAAPHAVHSISGRVYYSYGFDAAYFIFAVVVAFKIK